MRLFVWLASLVGAGLAFAGPAAAHEVRPAYLELRARDDLHFDMRLKLPVLAGRALSVALAMPDDCTVEILGEQALPGAALATGQVNCKSPPYGKTARLSGLENTLTDALVRVVQADGASATVRLAPERPSFAFPRPNGPFEVFATYARLGVEHILTGFDHLTFVAGLVLIVGSFRRVITTVTAFTLAHSLTLTLAALGVVHIPPAPVEALIALSILLVAKEAVDLAQGRPGPVARRPAAIAFTFGLLHGLGFAAALAETGLPEHAIPLALFSFNVGVEIGQIAFILALAAAGWAAGAIAKVERPMLLRVGGYGIGGLSAFWLIDRAGTVLFG